MEQIDWDALGAAKMPIWLAGLRSLDREVRNNAFKELQYYLLPWEAIEFCTYDVLALIKRESVIRAIPFVVALLSIEGVQDKDLLLYLLNNLLDYEDGEICLAEEQIKEYRVYVDLIYDSVAQGNALYRILAAADSSEIHNEAIWLQQSLTDHRK